MSAFDMERAKAGEKVQRLIRGEWEPVKFIGESISGQPVIQTFLFLSSPHISSKTLLRMAPKPPREMWIQVYMGSLTNRINCTYPHSSPEAANMAADNCKRLGKPQKILVEEE